MVTGRKAWATVNDLTRGIRKDMRKSDLYSKDREGDPKRFPRLEIGHKSNRMFE